MRKTEQGTHAKILGHRGYSGICPENTKLSFDTAVNFGFNGFEMDVHLTKDQELVVIHDETTKRTALVDKKIQDTNLAELKKLDQAAFFKISCPRQEILTMKEFLDLYLAKIEYLNIEIKTDIIDYQGIEPLLNDLVKQYPDAYEKVIFSSFNFGTLRNLHKLNPKWVIGFLYWTERQFNKIDPKEIKQVCKYLHPWTQIYDKRKKEHAKLGLPFNLWTLKSAKEYQKYLNDPDVRFLISNYKY